MSTELATIKLPTLPELIEVSEKDIKDSALMVLLNQDPPTIWIKDHPIAKMNVVIDGKKVSVPVPYLPAERIEYLLSRIFTKWWMEIKSVQLIANSCVVVVRLFVINPLTKEVERNDGVGATMIQTDAGASASDWSKIKHNGVQLAAPSAETYAFKDAAEKFGKLFGKDLSRSQQISYDSLLKTNGHIDPVELRELYDIKKATLTPEKRIEYERILDGKEVKSYAKIQKELAGK